MKRYASVIAGFVADTSVKLGSSPMRTLALTGYGLTAATVYGLQLQQRLGVTN